MQTLQRASVVRRTLATMLLAASSSYVQAARVVAGLAVQYACAPPPLVQRVAAWVMAVLLAPLHRLAQALVFGKIRSALGIKEAGRQIGLAP